MGASRGERGSNLLEGEVESLGFYPNAGTCFTVKGCPPLTIKGEFSHGRWTYVVARTANLLSTFQCNVTERTWTEKSSIRVRSLG